MTPREIANSLIRDRWIRAYEDQGDDDRSFSDRIEKAIADAVAEERAENVKRLVSLAALFDEPGWPAAAGRYVVRAIKSINQSGGRENANVSWKEAKKYISAAALHARQ